MILYRFEIALSVNISYVVRLLRQGSPFEWSSAMQCVLFSLRLGQATALLLALAQLIRPKEVIFRIAGELIQILKVFTRLIYEVVRISLCWSSPFLDLIYIPITICS